MVVVVESRYHKWAKFVVSDPLALVKEVVLRRVNMGDCKHIAIFRNLGP